MTEELYINGTLMDIENVDIVRKYISPFFRDVNILRNNGSYTVKLPPTATNLKAFGLSDRLDMFSDIPYQVNTANYYYDGFPVFENADCILIGVAEDGFIEVQFTWGLSKSKYLPLFEKKLNEIVPNGTTGTTIAEDDWIVQWDKGNGIDTGMFTPGKKYRYLDYVSGERESDVRILDGDVQPMAQAPAPFNSNLKEMTMHPFVEFSDMLDLIVNDAATQIAKEMVGNPVQNVVSFADVDGLRIGDLLVAMGSEPDLADFNIRITWINGLEVTFSEEVYQWYDEGFNAYFIQTNLASNVFDALKPRLTNKGLILGGNKADKTIEYTRQYVSETPLDSHVFQVEGGSTLYKSLPLGYFSSSFGTDSILDLFSWNGNVLSNNSDELEVHVNLILLSNVTINLYLYSLKRVPGTSYNEIIEVQELPNTPYTEPGGYTYKRAYDTTIKIKKEGLMYFIGYHSSSDVFIKAGGELKITHKTKHSIFSTLVSSTINPGHYNCLLNLPEMTFAEFIQQILIMTGMFIGYDKNGDIRFISFDNLKGKVQSGTAYNRSGRIGEITKNEYRFENFAQRNIIKFNNSDDVGYVAQGELTVNDLTLDKERDMYVIKFDLAEQSADGKAQFILYKQRVTETEKGGKIEKGFENNYSEKPSVCVYDDNGVAKVLQVLPNSLNGETGFIEAYYGVMQKIIERPRVIECEDNMDIITSANIDYEKPFYADELGGRYAVLLELQAPNNEPCVAKLLLINQKL